MPHGHLGLVVDDAHDVREEVELMLLSMGHKCKCASNQEEAESLLAKHEFCYVLLDLLLPVKGNKFARIETGFNILEGIRRKYPKEELPVIVMTSHGREHAHAVRAMKMGANDYIKKPFDSNVDDPLEVIVRREVEKSCELRNDACPNFGEAGKKATGGMRKKKSGRKSQVKFKCRTDHRFHFSGECLDRRYRMKINGKEVWVRLGTFECLWKFAVHLWKHPPGWVGGKIIHDNYHHAFSRLKADLKDRAGIDGSFIENDGHGKFRLSIPPDNVTCDMDCIRSNFPQLHTFFESK